MCHVDKNRLEAIAIGLERLVATCPQEPLVAKEETKFFACQVKYTLLALPCKSH